MDVQSYRKLIVFLFGGMALLCGLTGCDPFVGQEPETSNDLTDPSPEALEAYFRETYRLLGDPALYGGGVFLTADLLAGDGLLIWSDLPGDREAIYRKAIRPDNQAVGRQWERSYEVIDRLNLLLQTLEEYPFAGSAPIAGSAQTLRALLYFDLIRAFAAPFDVLSDNSGPGVPLYLEPRPPADSLYLLRASVAAVYDRILEDLQEAIPLLPEQAEEGVWRTQALALQAAVALQMGRYSTARDAADAVLRSGEYRLEDSVGWAFNREFPSREVVWSLPLPAWQWENELAGIFGQGSSGSPAPPVEVLPAFLERFSPQDRRRGLFPEENGRLYCAKWREASSVQPLFRLPEMYLIRAEANWRLGTTFGAAPLDDLQAVRSRAGLSPLSALDPDRFWEAWERELAFEGRRLHQLKRLKRRLGARSYDDERLVLPIPQSALDRNPLLEQNPGY